MELIYYYEATYRQVIVMNLRSELACKKCNRNIRISKVIIINKKLVCPFCCKTLETNKSKVEFVEKLVKALK